VSAGILTDLGSKIFMIGPFVTHAQEVEVDHENTQDPVIDEGDMEDIRFEEGTSTSDSEEQAKDQKAGHSIKDTILECMTADMDSYCREEMYTEVPVCYEDFEESIWQTDIADEAKRTQTIESFQICIEGRTQQICRDQLGDNINRCIENAVQGSLRSFFDLVFQFENMAENEKNRGSASALLSPTAQKLSPSSTPTPKAQNSEEEFIGQCPMQSENLCCGFRSLCAEGNDQAHLLAGTGLRPLCRPCEGVSKICVNGEGCVWETCSSSSDIYTRKDGTCVACFTSKRYVPEENGIYLAVQSSVCEQKEEDPDFRVGWKTFAEYGLTEEDRFLARQIGNILLMSDPEYNIASKSRLLLFYTADNFFYGTAKLGNAFLQNFDFYTFGLFGEKNPETVSYYNQLVHTNMQAEREADRRNENRPSFLKRFAVNLSTGLPTIANNVLMGLPNMVTGGGIDKMNEHILSLAYGDNEAEKAASVSTSEASSVLVEALTLALPGDFALRTGARAARTLPRTLQSPQGSEALRAVTRIDTTTISSVRSGTQLPVRRRMVEQGKAVGTLLESLGGKDSLIGSLGGMAEKSILKPLRSGAQSGGESVSSVMPALGVRSDNTAVRTWFDALFSRTQPQHTPVVQRGKEVILGRDPQRAHVSFPDQTAMADRHFAYGIHPQTNQAYIRDLGSGMGTRVNGQPVDTNGRYVQPGDTIEIDTASGGLDQFVVDDGYNVVHTGRQRQVVQGPGSPHQARKADSPTSQNVSALPVARPGQEVILGRDAAHAHVVLKSNMVSRQHAAYGTHPTTGMAYIRDLGSRNGTYVNGRLIDNRGVLVQSGDRIRLAGDYSDVELLIDQHGNVVDVREWRIVAKPEYNYRTIANTAQKSSQNSNRSGGQTGSSAQRSPSPQGIVSLDSSHRVHDSSINMANRSGGHPNQDAVASPLEVIGGGNQKYRIAASADGVSTARGGGGISRDSARVAHESVQKGQAFLREELLHGRDPKTAIRYALERVNSHIRAGDGAAAVNLYVVDQTSRKLHVGNVGDGVLLLVTPGSRSIQVLNHWDMFDVPIARFLNGENNYNRPMGLDEALRLPGASSVKGVIGQSYLLPHIRSHTLPDGDFYILSASDQLYKMLARDIRPVSGRDWEVTSSVLSAAAQSAGGDPKRFIQAVSRYNDGGDDLGMIVEGYQSRSRARNSNNQGSAQSRNSRQRQAATAARYSFQQVQQSIDTVLQRYPRLRQETIYVPFREEEMPYFQYKLAEVEACVQRNARCRRGLHELYTKRSRRLFNTSNLRGLRQEEKVFLATRAYAVELKIPADNLRQIVTQTNAQLQKHAQRAGKINGGLAGNPLVEDLNAGVIKSGEETVIMGYGVKAHGLGVGVDEILLNYDQLSKYSLSYQQHVYMHEKIHSIQIAANGGSLSNLSKFYRRDTKDTSWVEVFTEWLTRRELQTRDPKISSISYDTGARRLEYFITNGLHHGYIRQQDLQRFIDAAVTGDFRSLRSWLRNQLGTDLPLILGNTSDYDFYHGTYN
jgi:pSer/pThr/pTyr-binding forkhead associated (FHA) protein